LYGGCSSRLGIKTGLPDGLFSKKKNTNLRKFWRTLEWKKLKYFMAVWNILWTFGIVCDHLVHFVLIWYIIPVLGIMYQEKSGNPG
jgi:hypothetical protein